jgi:hypothetical protein
MGKKMQKIVAITIATMMIISAFATFAMFF